MNYDEINTFLTVIEYGSIAKAAQAMYIEQGTASKRIHLLEEQLGVQLFFRKKGIRKVVLTPEGEIFFPIAQQVVALLNDAKNLKSMILNKKLKIASTHSINHLFLLDFFKIFMEKHSDIEIFSQTEHSKEIYDLVENQSVNIGFANTLHNNPNIIAKPLFSEEYVFLYHHHSKFAKTLDPKDLSDIHEIYQTWSDEFSIWHKHFFPYFKRSKITLGNLVSTFEFLNDTQDWTIVNKKVAINWINNHTDWQYSPIPGFSPQRTTYVLYHKYPNPGVKMLTQFFLDEFISYISCDESIKRI